MSNDTSDTTRTAGTAQAAQAAQATQAADGMTVGNITVANHSLSRFNWRLAIALFVAAMLWIGPYVGSLGVVVPALLEIVAPAEKVALIAGLGIGGAVIALVSNILFGALSDLTRSRFGRRGPWIVVGSVLSALTLLGMSTASGAASVIAWWCAYMFTLNIIVAPMVAVVSDRVPEKYRGTVSSVYGVGMMLGVALAQIVGAGFVLDPRSGLVLFAVATLASGFVFVVVAPDRSNKHDERESRFTAATLLSTLRFPRRGARDFYLALFAKFFFQTGMYAITNYQLYILTDYIGLDAPNAATVIATMASIQLVTALVGGFTFGPLSDKLGRRKIFVIVAAVLVALGVAIPFFAPFAWGMLGFALLAGIGNGAFTSVDQALNVEVLPDRGSAAKDLGILNMANTGGQMLGPVITSIIVATTGGYGAVFIAAFCVVMVGALVIIPIRSVR